MAPICTDEPRVEGNCLGVVGVGVAGDCVHLREPAGEAEELFAIGEEESAEVAETDGFGVEAGVGFEAPAEIGTAPGSEAMAAGGVPKKAKGLNHRKLTLKRL